MHSRFFTLLVHAVFAIMFLASPMVIAVAAADRPPNIIMVLVDDYGWTDLSYSAGQGGGSKLYETPNIDKLAARGVRADLVPAEFRGEAAAESLLAALGDRVRGARVLLPRAEVAREVLPDTLRRAGAIVDVVAAYRTVGALPEDAEQIRALLAAGAIDVVALTSSSTIEQLVALLGDDAIAQLAGVTIASIGPITTATAEKLGLRVAVTAAEYTTGGLLDALTAHFLARTA